MRVLVVATNIDVPGTHGGSTHVTELVAALGRRATTMLLARRGSHGDGVLDVGLWPRTPPRGLRHAMTLFSVARAARRVREFAPDVIYERGSSYGTGAVLGMITGAPVVCMVLDEHVSPISLDRAAKIIATAPDLVSPELQHKTVRVSWGANVARFDPGVDPTPLRARLGLGRPLVTYAGSFRDWHGVDVLLDALALCRHRAIDVLLVGDGPERRRLLERSRSLPQRILMPGALPYDEMPQALVASDVFVAPFVPTRHPLSQRRGFVLDPLKLFESLASEVPTITVRARNIEALFTDGEHLAMVPPESPRDLANAIDAMLDDPMAARDMARRGGARVREHYTWDAHAHQLHGLFESVCRSGRSRND
jgi:glycosyltransferase involved in cell wall biosynthesis